MTAESSTTLSKFIPWNRQWEDGLPNTSAQAIRQRGKGGFAGSVTPLEQTAGIQIKGSIWQRQTTAAGFYLTTRSGSLKESCPHGGKAGERKIEKPAGGIGGPL
jgi:hypothetical protein